MNGLSLMLFDQKYFVGMKRWQDRVAVVTGASSGIGAAIVKDFLKNGLKVVGLARRVDLMEEIKKGLPPELQAKFACFYCDVCDLQSVNKAFDDIIGHFGAVDILVNNAGCMNCGGMSTMDIGDIQQVFNTNIMGVIHCTQRAFKSMKERNFDGHIILMNSIVGYSIPCFPKESPPLLSPYIASKHALRVMTESYRQEFNHYGTKIKITSIVPGVTDTDMAYEWLRIASGHNFLNVKDVSDSVMYVVATPPHVQVHEMVIKPVCEFVS